MPTTLQVNTQQIMQMGTHTEKLQHTIQSLPNVTAQQANAVREITDEIKRTEVQDLENVYFSKSPFSEMEKLMSITYASIVVLRALEISKMMRLSKTIPPLSCGVPVLFSGWGETADIIDKYEAGIVCSPEDSKQLADSIIYLADHPEVREKMSHSARQLAQKEFDWGYIVNDWVRQINNITDGKEPDIKNLDLHY